jgi:hypothetical protein
MGDRKLQIGELAKGAVNERVAVEIDKVLENIADPNTLPTKVRKVTVTLVFKPDKQREMIDVAIEAKSSVCPYDALSTKICLGKDSNGKVIAEEYSKGQMPGQSKIDVETGEIVESNVVNLRATK